jgi:CheY-like chemotaxis protein
LLPGRHVAWCFRGKIRNIQKQKYFADCHESPTKVGMTPAAPNILVVEDDRETRALIAKYLRTNACNVTTANDGREMVRAMADHRVDLVILDVMLPGEDGLSLCRKVRAESQTPIIMLTARGEDVDRILGLEMGAVPCQTIQSARIAGPDQRGAAPPDCRPDGQPRQWRDRPHLPGLADRFQASGTA